MARVVRGSSATEIFNIGEDDDEIICICDNRDDDGLTVACDLCNKWQHQLCYYPDFEDQSLPDDLQHFCVTLRHPLCSFVRRFDLSLRVQLALSQDLLRTSNPGTFCGKLTDFQRPDSQFSASFQLRKLQKISLKHVSALAAACSSRPECPKAANTAYSSCCGSFCSCHSGNFDATDGANAATTFGHATSSVAASTCNA